MKMYEVLYFNRELLDRLSAMGIRCEDSKYVDLYIDYTEFRGVGHKKTYIVAVLAERYHISERKVYAVLSRLEGDCKIPAVVPPGL